jgi:quercetin 2,3-dioxygenase
MNVQLYPAGNRQHIAHGTRFDSWQSFSFGNWYDEKRNGFGVLRVFNDDTIGPESEIGMHPHRNYEILSVMLEGRMSHRDSLGHYQEIETNDIQLISCGSGIEHAGKNLAENQFTRFLQIWVQPNQYNTAPGLQLRQFSNAQAQEQWSLRVSPTGDGNTLQIKQDCWCSMGHFTGHTNYTLHKPGNGVWLFVLQGGIEVNGVKAAARDALMITGAAEIDITTHISATIWLMELPLNN